MDLERAILDHVQRRALRLPPYPATALKLRRLLEDPAHHLSQVVELVKSDAPLAAAVLRVANSAMWVGLGEITTLAGAVARIGEAELGRLALASGLAAEGNARGPLAQLRRHVWHDSISTAVCAGILAPSFGLDRDELFVAGLLHDIGRNVCLTLIEALLGQHPAEPARTASEWWRLVERHHVELGMMLATKWQLPALFVDCISQHHSPSPSGKFSRHVAAIAAVDQLVDVLNSGVPITGPVLATLVVVAESVDCARVAAELGQAPALIASFEDPTVPERASKVTPERVGGEAFLPTRALRLHLDDGTEARCTSARATEVAFTSGKPMTENFLQQLEVALPDGRFPLWFRVAACSPSAGGYAVVGHPFGLSGPALAGWLSVTRDGPGLLGTAA